ncbi:MAG: hypothetical protein ACREN5_00410 [Gemmatimonadales bacterium]
MRRGVSPLVLTALLATWSRCASGAPQAHTPTLTPPTPSLVTRDTVCSLPPAVGGLRRDTVVIALTDTIDWSHAPTPRSTAERLVFGQLFRPALRRDCEGRFLSGGIGGGPYRVAVDDSAALVLVPPDSGGGPLPVLVFRRFRGADARDILDAGVDLLITDDAAALQYAARRPDLVSVALPWQRTYLLAVRTPASAPRLGYERGLEHAVRVEARVSLPPFWWLEAGASCATGAPIPHADPRAAARVAYNRSDAVARDLADRVVALRLLDPGSSRARLSAVAMSPEEFAVALTRATEWAYVVPISRQHPDLCAAATQVPPWVLAANPIPLIDTRFHAIVRRGAGVSGVVDWDGSIRITPP